MMKLPNDIDIRKCLYMVLGITMAAFAVVYLDVPVLRQLFGFLFLAFVPGVLILRILRVHNISVIESLGYTVGLSLTFVMFGGALINFVLPRLGVERPISLYPLMATFGVSTLILCVLAYWRDRDFTTPKKTLALVFSAPHVFLLMLPVLAIGGALFMRFFDSPLLALIFIAVVVIVVGLIGFDKFIPKSAYGLAIAMIAIALLYHTTLTTSGYHIGGDFWVEHYFLSRVIDSGYWVSSTEAGVVTSLSIMMVCPVYSTVLGASAMWILKIVYPLLFCLVPLVLFHIFRTQLSARMSFFAAFFFMSTLYATMMLTVNRQQIAELFLVLFVLLLVERNLPPVQKAVLAIIFTLSIVVSHYGLGIVCAGFFAATWFIMFFFRRCPRAFSQLALALIIGVYILFGCGWYSTTASGKIMKDFEGVINQQAGVVSEAITRQDEGEPNEIIIELIIEPVIEPIIEPVIEPNKVKHNEVKPDKQKTSIFLDMNNREPLIRTALGLDFFDVSLSGKGFRVFQYVTQFFVFVGFIGLIFRFGRHRFKPEFVALSVGAVLMLSACVMLPYLAGYLQPERYYQIGLLLLAPLCVTGGAIIWQFFIRSQKHYFKFIALVLITYFLFTSGFIFEVTNHDSDSILDTPSSGGVSNYRLPEIDTNPYRDRLPPAE